MTTLDDSNPSPESFDEIPETRTSEGRIFPCEGCGADLRFDVGVQQLKCEYCGGVKVIAIDAELAVREQDFAAMLNRVAERRMRAQAPVTDAKEVTCDNCGGRVQFTGTLASDECAYCGSAIQVENAYTAEDRIPVDGVLPFRVDRGRAQANLAAWVKSRWFAPNEFKRRGVHGRFNGVYLPYWTYDAMTTTHWSGQRGDNYTVWVGTGKDRRMETRTRWSFRSGVHQRFFDDITIPAATGWPAQRLEALEPWPIEHCRPFEQAFLAGYLASTYDVELDDGFTLARQRADAALRSDVRRAIGGDQQRISSIDTQYDAITFKHLLLPVWTLVYRYHGKPYQVFVNAGTGEVQGDRPWSWIKILMAIVFAAGALGAAVYFWQGSGL
ncbi:MAG TPA: hypothetical protein P5081_17260 [Phycisphaerae bacterium]|nr:hypothetical protein [Phycisphaerae bacterium]HRW54621.1 hypothetical protein [Phycisphaerae bacterium]